MITLEMTTEERKCRSVFSIDSLLERKLVTKTDDDDDGGDAGHICRKNATSVASSQNLNRRNRLNNDTNVSFKLNCALSIVRRTIVLDHLEIIAVSQQ